MCVLIDRILVRGRKMFFTVFLVMCLAGLFYLPEGIVDRFFTSGMIWTGMVVSVFLILYLLFREHQYWYVSSLVVCLIAAWAGIVLYSWGMGLFVWQQIFFWGVLCILSLLFSQMNKGFKLQLFGGIISGFACGIALWGLGQKAGWWEVYNSHHVVTAAFDNPAGLAAWLGMAFPFALQLTGLHRKFWKWWGGGVALLIVVAIILSGSRMGMVCIILVMIIWLYPWLSRRGRHLRLYCAVGIVLGALLVVGLYKLKKDSADGRLLIWRCCWEMICDKPLLGHGVGSFSSRYMEYQAAYLDSHPDERMVWLADNVKHPFNEYLKITVEYGLTGLLFVGGLIGLLISMYRSSRREMKPVYISLMVVGVAGLFSYPLNYPAVCVFLFVDLGLVATEGTSGKKISGRGKDIMAGVLAVGLLGGCVYWKRLENRWYFISRQALAGKSEQMLPHYAGLYPWLHTDALFLYNYGAELHEAGHWEESNTIMRECLRGWNDTDVQLLLAENYAQLGDYPQAETCLWQAFRMCPNRFLPLYRLVELYRDTGRTAEALRLARQIVGKPVKIPSYMVKKIKQEMEEYIGKPEQEYDQE